MSSSPPDTDIRQLKARAELLATVRSFFAARGVLEVETPLLCSTGVTDPSIEPLVIERGESLSAPRYLQTSPEYAMKRLLAAGSGPIYQLGKAFRDGEAGSRHNPEFSLLEWYRPGLVHHQLMDEVAELLCLCLGSRQATRTSYRELFLQRLGIDPMLASVDDLRDTARRHLDPGTLSGDRDMWLDLLMSHVIEPGLADGDIHFVYDYPASQAALSRVINLEGMAVAERFEVYVDGVELGNGYHELNDATEQRVRFEADNRKRVSRGQVERPIDEYLLEALEYGLPSCSGVAIGVDRLLMVQTGTTDIRQLLAMDWERC